MPDNAYETLELIWRKERILGGVSSLGREQALFLNEHVLYCCGETHVAEFAKSKHEQVGLPKAGRR